MLATCQTSNNCAPGEACIITGENKTGQCITVGLPLSTNTNKTIPIPCTGNSCYSSTSGIVCNTQADATDKLPSPDTVWPCKTNSDCPTGLTCPTLGGNCTGGTNATVGYCVQCDGTTSCGKPSHCTQ